MKKEVVRTVMDSENEVSIDVYADGDCIITMPSGSYCVLTKKILSQIVVKDSIVVKASKVIISTPPVVEKKEKVASSFSSLLSRKNTDKDIQLPKNDVLKVEKKFTRKIEKVIKKDNSVEWKSTWISQKGDPTPVSHFFLSRDKARAGLITTEIGSSGRIS